LQAELQQRGGSGGGGRVRKSRKKRVQREDGTYGMCFFFVFVFFGISGNFSQFVRQITFIFSQKKKL